MTVAVWIIAIILMVFFFKEFPEVFELILKSLKWIGLTILILFVVVIGYQYLDKNESIPVEQSPIKTETQEEYNQKVTEFSSKAHRMCFDEALEEMEKDYDPKDPIVFSDGTVTNSRIYLECMGK